MKRKVNINKGKVMITIDYVIDDIQNTIKWKAGNLEGKYANEPNHQVLLFTKCGKTETDENFQLSVYKLMVLHK